MKNLIGMFLVAATAMLPAHAAEPAARSAAEPDPALVDAIVRKLETDGVLDRAVEEAITRVVNRQRVAQQAAEEQRESALRDRVGAARPVSRGRDHIRGNAAAEVSIIEYSDFECPYCKRFHPTPGELTRKFGDRVNWIYRHLPLEFHNPAARREAIASECAGKLGGNEMFWKYSDAIFEHTRSNGAGLPAEHSEAALAARQGLNGAAFARCLTDPASAKRVDEDLADAVAVRMSGTPTTLIRNNRTGATEVVVGARSADYIAPIIERVLGGKR